MRITFALFKQRHFFKTYTTFLNYRSDLLKSDLKTIMKFSKLVLSCVLLVEQSPPPPLFLAALGGCNLTGHILTQLGKSNLYLTWPILK